IEGLDIELGETCLHPFQQGQEFPQRYRQLCRLQLKEERDKHGYCRCRARKASLSNRCTSCSFFSRAPCRRGKALRVSARRSSGPSSSATSSRIQSRASEVEGRFFSPGISRIS